MRRIFPLTALGLSLSCLFPVFCLFAAAEDVGLERPRAATGWWLPESLSTISGDVDRLFYTILILTVVVFIGVQGTLLAFAIRYRDRRDAPLRLAPPVRGSTVTETIWTVIPFLILTVLAFSGQSVWKRVKTTALGGSAAVAIRVQAEQFAWNIQYPGRDGRFDTEDDLRFINQMHIPAGRPIQVTLTSIAKDNAPAVVHSFFIPEFRIKQDVVPGLSIDVAFEATATGRYEIACAEFCGLGHYRMRGFLSIHSQSGYEAWLESETAVRYPSGIPA